MAGGVNTIDAAGTSPHGTLYGYIRPDPLSGLSSIAFDILISEDHNNTTEVTDHPVEIGPDVSDNTKNVPETITLTGFVTNTPLDPVRGGSIKVVNLPIPVYTRPPLGISNALDALGSALGGFLFGPPKFNAQLLQFPTPFDVVTEVHNALTTVERGKFLCQIITSTKQYDNMILNSVSYKKTEAGGGDFTIIGRRINMVSTGTVAAPVPKIPAGKPPTNGGPQTPKNASDGQLSSIGVKLGQFSGILP